MHHNEEKNLITELSENRLLRWIFALPGIRQFVKSKFVLRICNQYKKILNKEMVSYLWFGVLATLVNWIMFYVVSRIADGMITEQTDTATTIRITIANIIAIACSVVFAYFTNSKWVFCSPASTPKERWAEFGKFVLARGVTIVFELVTVPLMVNQLRFSDMLAKVLASIVVIILNYILSKKAVFVQKSV